VGGRDTAAARKILVVPRRLGGRVPCRPPPSQMGTQPFETEVPTPPNGCGPKGTTNAWIMAAWPEPVYRTHIIHSSMEIQAHLVRASSLVCDRVVWTWGCLTSLHSQRLRQAGRERAEGLTILLHSWQWEKICSYRTKWNNSRMITAVMPSDTYDVRRERILWRLSSPPYWGSETLSMLMFAASSKYSACPSRQSRQGTTMRRAFDYGVDGTGRRTGV